MELPDALPEMPVLREPYLLKRRTASTGLDPDSTKLAVEVDSVGAMVLQPASPCANPLIAVSPEGTYCTRVQCAKEKAGAHRRDGILE